ncbi:restriction endonuclease subunit S [Candidatus Accumulibacter phosphatis]|uniref:restriction endonuclease subunit S n=1 Tax=Candidatus Accumulibacter phosphatis TaxID=327160 RepID=UPI0039B94C05
MTLIDCDHRTPPAADAGYPYIAIPQLKEGRLDLSGVRRISPELFAEWTRKAKPRHHDVVLSRRCNPGETAYVPAGLECALGQNLVLLRSDGEKVFPPFLRWLLHGPDWWEQVGKSINVGAIFNSLKCADIPNFRMPLPPLAEQKAIAAVLGALDDKIELNRRMNATLEAMARALFQSWFVDFDPVRAKLDARPPAGLDSATAALFPEHFEHGEDAMLPIGWRHAAIEEVCAINAWTLGKNDDLETLEYVEISEVSRGNIANIATYTRGEEPSRARRRLRHGDTVLSTVRPDRGSYFLALNPPENRVASTGFAVLTPTKVPWSFVHAAMTQPEVSEHLGQMADGGAYPAVRPEIIGAMKVALPNERKILEAFHRTCAPLFEQAETNRTQSRTLATLRDTLLPKLLSGELSVASFERGVPA